MDPDVNLAEQLELANRFVQQANTDAAQRSEFVPVDDAARLGELVISLHNWLCDLGHLPRKWCG